MFRKGQGGEVFKYLMIAAVIVVLTITGVYFFQNVKAKLCEAEIAEFAIQMQDIGTEVKIGSVAEKTVAVPCNADEIYFFDLAHEIDVTLFRNSPLLRDSVASGADKNVFLIKNNQLMDSLYVGDLDITYPYFMCLVPKFDMIGFFLEGKAGAAAVFPTCTQPECTYVPVETSDSDAARIITEARDFGDTTFCRNCPDSVTTSWAQYIQTNENVHIERKYEYCRETGITNVEITIAPRDDAALKQLVFYENIPKECIDDIHDYLAFTLDESKVDIKADPMIMWQLDDVEDEHKITYAVKTFLSEECKQEFDGIAIAEIVEDGKTVPVPEVPTVSSNDLPTQNTEPTFKVPNQNIEGKLGHQIVIPQLWRFADDNEIADHLLGFTLVDQTNDNHVTCEVLQNEQLVCEVLENTDSLSDITISAFDGEFVVESTFRLRLNRYYKPVTCGDGTCDAIESCSSCEQDCGRCVITGPKILHCGLNPQSYCSATVSCPAGTFLDPNSLGDCDCFPTCKTSYTCVSRQVTSCSDTSACASGIVLAEVPCTPPPPSSGGV